MDSEDRKTRSFRVPDGRHGGMWLTGELVNCHGSRFTEKRK